MSLQLNKLYDPRGPLEKARRKELERFAKANGVTEVKPGMPAPIMRKILKAKGLVNIPLPSTRYLGGPSDMQILARQDMVAGYDSGPVEEVDEISVLMADWEKQRRAPDLPDPYENMSINDLRAACKERGIKMSRRDNMDSLRRKLRGEDAS